MQKIFIKFLEIINLLQIDLKNDSSWPKIAFELLKNVDEDIQQCFWEEVESYFLDIEKQVGYCHKGQIYWRLSLLHLQKGDIAKCIDYLEKSGEENKKNDATKPSAALNLLSVLKPLEMRYKEGKSWSYDKEIMEFYFSLGSNEKRDFAKEFYETHDMIVKGHVMTINEDSFGFISDKQIREVIHNTYNEVRDIILMFNLKTYYSCIFLIGSILEGMLDDLFKKDNQNLWKIFSNDEDIQSDIDKKTKLASSTYEDGMTLGQKNKALRLLAKYNKLTIMPRHAVLQMLIIGEYRDLIHPRRRLYAPYKPSKYVACFLFNMIERFAGNWWPEKNKAYN